VTEKVSALMDGELEDSEADGLIKRLSPDAGPGAAWSLYHLIGESLRRERIYAIDVVASVSERLSGEPTVLAPPRRRSQRLQVVALSAAASVVAVAMVAWVMLQGQAPSTAVPMAQAPVSPPALVVPVSANMNDYLRAHQEYSPSTQILGVAPYIRTVSGVPGRDAQQ
jgi:sigma-E factor negative regulatory protein RseA